MSDKTDIDYVLDELGVKSEASRDLLTPGIRGHLDGCLGLPTHTREQTVEHMKETIERSRSIAPDQQFIREYDLHMRRD